MQRCMNNRNEQGLFVVLGVFPSGFRVRIERTSASVMTTMHCWNIGLSSVVAVGVSWRRISWSDISYRHSTLTVHCLSGGPLGMTKKGR